MRVTARTEKQNKMKKTAQQVFDEAKASGMDTWICISLMNEAHHGKVFYKCICKAKDNDSLSFSDCTEILRSVYGCKAVEKMSRENLFNKINSMMRCVIDYTDTEMIDEEIDYIKS